MMCIEGSASISKIITRILQLPTSVLFEIKQICNQFNFLSSLYVISVTLSSSLSLTHTNIQTAPTLNLTSFTRKKNLLAMYINRNKSPYFNILYWSHQHCLLLYIARMISWMKLMLIDVRNMYSKCYTNS